MVCEKPGNARLQIVIRYVVSLLGIPGARLEPGAPGKRPPHLDEL